MRVLAALSGGVDSSVTAALLRDAGHDVVGVTMKLWGGASDTGCCSVSDVEDARRAAAQLGVDHHVFNFGDEFEERVVAPYVADHAAGRTPNPCMRCNERIKFAALLDKALALGFDAVVTGHYAEVRQGADGPELHRAAAWAKDQSYVLGVLTAEQLAHAWFPLGAASFRRARPPRCTRPPSRPRWRPWCPRRRPPPRRRGWRRDSRAAAWRRPRA